MPPYDNPWPHARSKIVTVWEVFTYRLYWDYYLDLDLYRICLMSKLIFPYDCKRH